MKTMTIWKIYNPDINGGYNWDLEAVKDDAVKCEPVSVAIPDGFEVGESQDGKKMFFRADGKTGYSLVSSYRWAANCHPMLIGGDDAEIVHLYSVD